MLLIPLLLPALLMPTLLLPSLLLPALLLHSLDTSVPHLADCRASTLYHIMVS